MFDFIVSDKCTTINDFMAVIQSKFKINNYIYIYQKYVELMHDAWINNS